MDIKSFFNDNELAILEADIEAGYISKKKHPEFDLWIYNYTNQTQYDWHWDGVTNKCRGVILDACGCLVAKGFDKFFTLDQLINMGNEGDIPTDEPFKIYDKVDGSLGILYFWDDVPYIATRGSFESDMAIRATQILKTKYKDVVWNPDYSYIFEIIYPNVILTIDYGYEDLVLHGIFDNRTGEEVRLSDYYDFNYLYDMNVSMELPVETGDNFKGIEDFYRRFKYNNDEGYVIRFESGYRVKVKFDEYKELSRAKRAFAGDGTKRLYELCRDDKIEDILIKLPKHTISYRREIVDSIYQEYENVYVRHLKAFKSMYKYNKTIQRFAVVALETNKKYFNSGLLIKMFIGDYDGIKTTIWKIITDNRKVYNE